MQKLLVKCTVELALKTICIIIKTICLKRSPFTAPHSYTFHVIALAYKEHLCIRTYFVRPYGGLSKTFHCSSSSRCPALYLSLQEVMYVSDWGGIAGLCLGCSLVSLTELLELFTDLVRIYCRRCRRPRTV